MSRTSAEIELIILANRAKAEFSELGDEAEGATGKMKEFNERGEETEKSLEEIGEEAEETAEKTKKSGQSFTTVKDAAIATQGPLGGVASRLTALRNLFAALSTSIRSSVTSLKAFRTALLATGIGAVLVALGSLIFLLRRLQPVMDAIERVTSTVGTAFDFLATKVGAFFNLNEDVNRSFTETLRLQRELTRRTQELADAEINAIETRADLNRQIRESEALLRDENISIEERQQILADLEQAQKELFEIEQGFAQQRADIAEETAALAENDREANRELAEARAEVINVESRFQQQRRRFFREAMRLNREAEREEQERLARERERIAERLDLQRMRAEAGRAILASDLKASQELVAQALENIGGIFEGIDLDVGDKILPPGSIAALNQRLEGLRDQFEVATDPQQLSALRKEIESLQEEIRRLEGGARDSAGGFGELSQSIERAAASQLVLASNAQEAASAILDTIIQQIVGHLILSIIRGLPFPANLIVAAGARALAQPLIGAISSFQTGVDDFDGGMARVHRGEAVVSLPEGSNVLTNRNVERLDRMSERQPDIGDILRNLNLESESVARGRDIVQVVRLTLDQDGELGGRNAI